MSNSNITAIQLAQASDVTALDAMNVNLASGNLNNLDFTGGDFLLVESRPRMQSRGESVALKRGEAVIFPTRERPVEGTRGSYRGQLRHGVSTLLSGQRMTLGLIFHDSA